MNRVARAHRRLVRRARGDAGLSLTEVLVAMTLLVGAVIGGFSVLDNAGRASVSAERRVAAVSIASREIEAMKAAPYGVLGLDPAASGYSGAFEGRSTVALGSGAGFLPKSSEVVASTTFTITRNITWVPVTVGGSTVTQGYKNLTVQVSWSDGARSPSVREDGAATVTSASACATPNTDTAPLSGLTGVVNTYYPAVASAVAGATVLAIGAPSGSATAIAPGDLVLIVQMQDAVVSTSNSDAYGDGVLGAPAAGATAWRSTGLYEYAMATSLATSGFLSIHGAGVGGGLVNSYDAAASSATVGTSTFQVIRVPTYASATITSGLTALAWNGSVGGILAFDATGTVTMAAASVKVDGLGFRGAAANVGASTSAYVAATGSGEKGEGPAGHPGKVYSGSAVVDLGTTDLPVGSFGRGAPASAGGGANIVDAGGGGGGATGAGGDGGSPSGTSGQGGGGGGAAPASAQRLLLGGGGGAGGAGAIATVGSGGAGGGAVLIRAGSFSGPGTISAKGADGQTGVGGSIEGGGGGGAGGSVVLVAGSGLNALTANVSGGAGGAAPLVGSVYGAGGGGGGGQVRANAPLAAMTVSGGSGGAGQAAGVGSVGSIGSADTSFNASQIIGLPTSIGCQVSLTVTKSTSTPAVSNSTAAPATFIITVTNPGTRPTATSVTIADPLPSGVTYSSTTSITTAGGASQASVSNPTVGAGSPSWGVFTIPAGGSVAIVYDALVSASVASGTMQSNADASFLGQNGVATAWYFGGSSSAEDVVIQSFACATPSTDTAPASGITGIVNTYYPGTSSVSAGATTISVGTAVGSGTAVSAGDLLLVIQMQGSSINSTNTDSYGDGVAGTPASGVTALNGVGTLEYVVATSAVSGGKVTVTGSGSGGGLVNAYTASTLATFQVVRVPTYASGTKLGAALTARAWDGSAGGILAVDVAGTLDLNGKTADVTGLGFRGGGFVKTNDNNLYVVDSTTTNAGMKAEGVVGAPRIVYDGTSDVTVSGSDRLPGGDAGPGAPGDAGGGGLRHTGGGGGAGAGSGGRGGISTEKTVTASFAGLGITQGATRVLLGGGGGSGGADGTSTTVQGARGGGIVLMRTSGLTGTGAIKAAGSAAKSSTNKDGSGGGGGGGTVVLTTGGGLGGLTVDASGGAGGANAKSGYPSGGGGGGGAILLSGATATTTANGGAAGSVTAPTTGVETGSSGFAGTTSTSLASSQLTGIAMGVGCRPLMTVTKAAMSPTAYRTRSAQSAYTITVANGPGKASATGVSITDALPSGFTYNASSVALTGGASRTSTANPTAGSSTPVWGTFTIPAGGSVVISVTVDLASSLTVTGSAISNNASATDGAGVLVNFDSSVASDDVTLAAPQTILPLATIDDGTAPNLTVDAAAASLSAGGTLTGVINSYWPGVGTASAGATSISVGTINASGSATAIAAGDLLLVMQMQDATISSADSTSYGSGAAGGNGSGATSLGNAGLSEYVTATGAISGGSVSIIGMGAGGGLVNSYASTAATSTVGQRTFQVIRVPQYSSATVGAALTAAAWNGSSGGVLALDVSGTLTLASQTIDVSGLGFRGGGNTLVGGCGTTSNYLLTASCGGAKGEGIAGTPRYVATAAGFANLGAQGYPGGDFGRGAPGNAGGGGNSHNAGGGGGGNGGAGGVGGIEWLANSAVGGRGGAAVGRTVLGGGGGAGDANNNAAPVHNGGSGGGLVMLRATTLSGSGTVTADGATGKPTAPSFNDGGGGGGAGGSVVVVAGSGTSGLTVNARGGRGGAMFTTKLDGAGGGGGVVQSTGSLAASTVTGGLPGVVDTSGSASTATAGSAGTVTTALSSTAIAGVPLGRRADGTIAGVVNTYFPGSGTVTPGATSITVGASGGASTPIAAGDLLIVAQAQDGVINFTDSDSYGSGTSGSGAGYLDASMAGRYEYVIATSAVTTAGGTVSIAGAGQGGGLLNRYSTAAAVSGTSGRRSFQVIRVPRYAGATMGALDALAWDGTKGGVLAVDVLGSLALNGTTVDVTGKGFRGGGAVPQFNFDQSRWARTDFFDGYKGEGIAGTPRAVINTSGTTSDQGSSWVGYPGGDNARGAPADAGGGGEAHNAGGGGGGNGGAGGQGGNSYPLLGISNATGGRGGAAVPASADRLFLGGGAGAGDANDSCRAEGASGGALVIVRAGSLSGIGTLRSRGAAGLVAGCNDGGGGGGAGGTVAVVATSGLSGLTVDATGGAGGSSAASHGSGGGGGGGAILASAALAATNVSGGAGGTVGNTGATGSSGTVTTSLTATAMPGATLAGLINVVQPVASSDSRSFASGPWPSSFSSSSYVDVATTAIFPTGAGPLGGITNVNAVVTSAATGPGATACWYAEIRSASAGTVLASGGSLGTSSSPICVTGTTMNTTTAATGLTALSGAALNDMVLRLYVRDSTAGPVLFERATISIDWQGRTGWKLLPASITGQVSGSAFSAIDGAGLKSGDSVNYQSAGLVPTTMLERPMTLTFDGNPPSIATTSSATFSMTWQGPATSCWWAEVLNNGAVVATVGSSATPNCHATAAAATDTASVPIAAVTSGTVAVKIRWSSPSGASRISIDNAAIITTWSAT